jgi:hypothetical protein
LKVQYEGNYYNSVTRLDQDRSRKAKQNVLNWHARVTEVIVHPGIPRILGSGIRKIDFDRDTPLWSSTCMWGGGGARKYPRTG